MSRMVAAFRPGGTWSLLRRLRTASVVAGRRYLCRRDVGATRYRNFSVMLFRRVMQNAFQYSMDDQVGITAYRRREVRVARRSQSEMPFIHLRVAGLLQGAQHEEAENAFFRFSRDLLRQFLVHARGDVHFLR